MGRSSMVERSAPGSNVEGQLTGASANSQSRPNTGHLENCPNFSEADMTTLGRVWSWLWHDS